jgi:hypothetical protein
MCSVVSLIFASLIFPVALLFGGLMSVGVETTVGPLAPVVVTPAVPATSIEISADATSVQVGDTVTITGFPINLGIPYYTLTLSSGAMATVTYANEVRALESDAQFEIVSAVGEMNTVTFVLRALAPGTVEAGISATGEVTTPEGAFAWGGTSSPPLTLIVSN